MGYYRPGNLNLKWLERWTEFEDWKDALDDLAQKAIGIEPGASDELQKYAKHIHACLLAAFLTGVHYAGVRIPTNSYKEYLK